MRAGCVAAVCVTAVSSTATPALAEPRLTASGFVGVGTFGDSELGNSWAADQVPGSAMCFGARLGWLALPRLTDRLALGLEVELAMTTSSTGTGDARMSYFAPVLGWRAHALARFAVARSLAVHALAGAGGATLVSSSPFMASETDPVIYGGLGATVALDRRWQLRLDARQGAMPGRGGGMTRVTEVQLGLVVVLGSTGARRTPPPEPVVTPPPPTPTPPPPIDLPDPDSDGVVGPADACPLVPEDIDRWQDTDGCPDPDNDNDRIDDPLDVCPSEPETRNGYLDNDGCPDTVPEALTRTLVRGAAAVRFEYARARVTDAAKLALRPVLAVLQREPDVRLVITGGAASVAPADLGKRRAEAVKWYLVDQGVAADRLETVGAPPDSGAQLRLSLRF